MSTVRLSAEDDDVEAPRWTGQPASPQCAPWPGRCRAGAVRQVEGPARLSRGPGPPDPLRRVQL